MLSLFLLLLLPSKNIAFFYFFSVVFMFFNGVLERLNSKKFIYFVFFILLFFLVGGVYRSVIYNSDFWVFKEIVRFVFPVLVYYFLEKKQIPLKRIFSVLAIFSISDFSISALQFFGGRFGFIEQLYYNESALVTLKASSPRVLGLLPGVAEHGVVSMLLFIWSFCLLFVSRVKLRRLYLVLFCSLFSLLLSQSKTSIVAAIIAVSLVVVFYLKVYGKIIFLSVFVVLIFNIDLIFEHLYQLEKLYNNGLLSSSFIARVGKWEEFSYLSLKDPFIFIFGSGRSLLESYGDTFDSDYIFLFSVFGFFITLLVYFYMALFSFKISRFSGVGKDVSPFFIFISIVISGFAVSPLVYPTSQLLIVLLFWSSRNAKRIY